MSGMPEGDGFLVTEGGNGRIGDGFSIHVSCVIREAKDRIHEDLAELLTSFTRERILSHGLSNRHPGEHDELD